MAVLEAELQKLVQFSFCVLCWGFPNSSSSSNPSPPWIFQDAYSEIAYLFAEFFRDLDIVPSDIIAGLVLLRQRQRAKRNAVLDEVGKPGNLAFPAALGFPGKQLCSPAHLISGLFLLAEVGKKNNGGFSSFSWVFPCGFSLLKGSAGAESSLESGMIFSRQVIWGGSSRSQKGLQGGFIGTWKWMGRLFPLCSDVEKTLAICRGKNF